MGEATVWAHALDGRWERVGADRARGVWPEGLRATANDWGPDTCSFLVRRDPGAAFPDVLPFTPVDVEVRGERVWSGFVWEPPQQADERAIAVECRGWQYHADDDLVDRLYVHSRLGSWVDTRTLISTDLAVWGLSGTAESGDGAVVIGWAAGAEADAAQHTGVTLDLGRAEAKRIVVETEPINGNAAFTFIIRGHDTANPNLAGTFEDTSIAHESVASTFVGVTFTAARRYVTLLMYRDDGLSSATAADHLVRVRSAQVFREVAYESGDASVLKASAVAADLVRFCPLLDQRTDLIQTSDVNLPDFALEELTARQGMEQANAVHGHQLRVTPERLLEYRPRPAVPLFRVGAWGGAELAGASRGSGEPIHNRALVKGNDSSGGAVAVERWAAHQPGGVSTALDVSHPNPSFDTDVANWTAVVGTIQRLAAGFDTGPACMELVSPNPVPGWPGAHAQSGAFAGTWKKGRLYRVRLRLRGGTGTASGGPYRVTVTVGGVSASVELPDTISTVAYTDADVYIRPIADTTSGQIDVQSGSTSPLTPAVFVDSLGIGEAAGTLPDRRGFNRTRGIRVSRPLEDAIAIGMADASLREAMRTPFKGDLAVAPGGVRSFLGDAPVRPASLLRHTGELVHHSQLVDPDNGNLGRDARIAAVAYDDETGAAAATLDNTRRDFETQLARYEVTGRR